MLILTFFFFFDSIARALPSDSLPKKVATVSPNLTKARVFTPHRPMANVEPMSKIPATVDHSSVTESSPPLMSGTMCPIPSALSALSALSSSPLAVKPTTYNRPSELSPDLVEFSSKSEEEQQSSMESNGSTRNGSGLFDNLSLASQLEGFASCTSAAARPTAESLKDLLKTTNNATSENVVPSLRWNSDETLASVPPSWSDEQQFPTNQQHQWNNGGQWNDASTSSQVNWPWSQQTPSQQAQTNFSNANRSGGTSTAATPAADSYNNHQYSNNFDASNQWSNYNNTPTAANNSYTSHSLPPPNGHYSAPPYFPTSYFGSNAPLPPAYMTYPQTSQPGYNSLEGSSYHNQYGGNEFPPNYSQPYPGSYSQ